MIDLTGKTAIVTGSSRGIGRAIALTLAQAGARVAVTATTEAGTAGTVDAIKQAGGEAMGLAVRMNDVDSIREMISTVKKEWQQIDILVNNAGITRDNLLLRMSEQEWQEVIDVNLTGAFHAIKAVSRMMMKQRSGKIINITSVVGQMGNAGQVNYSAAKAGLIGMTKSVAKELASRNVQVNCVAPGYIETDMTKDLPESVREELLNYIPAGRMGKPEEVAAMVAFLASGSSDYITGQVFNVDGGMVMS